MQPALAAKLYLENKLLSSLTKECREGGKSEGGEKGRLNASSPHHSTHSVNHWGTAKAGRGREKDRRENQSH